jgi:hypothetical protein
MIEMAASEFVAILQETTLEIAIELTERDNPCRSAKPRRGGHLPG